MSRVVLLDYEDNHDYELIGIHTPLDDFRLAFFLNSTLHICLKRDAKDLDFGINNETHFSLYSFDCERTFINWSLIANKYNYLNEDENQLFSQQQQTSILIKEKKQIDYFLKIEGEINAKKVSEIVSKMNTVKNIITSYSINPQTLKSKDFLIF